MDFEILPQMIIVFSAAGILLIVGKNFSRVKEASLEEDLLSQTSIKAEMEKVKFMYLYKRALRRINKENYQKTLARFWVWLEKFLRKMRIFFLKLDGKMVSSLESLRQKNVQSIDRLKETEKNIRRNMENENYARFWNSKKSEKKPQRPAEIATKQDKEKEIIPIISEIETEEIVIFTEPTVAEKGTEEETVSTIDKQNTTESYEKTVLSQTEDAEEMATTAYYDKPVTAAGDIKAEDEEIEESDGEVEDNQKIRTRKEQECIEILMKNPADIRAYWKLGIIYSKRRNYDDALACFRQIVKIDPTYTKAKQKAIELMEKMKGKGK